MPGCSLGGDMVADAGRPHSVVNRTTKAAPHMREAIKKRRNLARIAFDCRTVRSVGVCRSPRKMAEDDVSIFNLRTFLPLSARILDRHNHDRSYRQVQNKVTHSMPRFFIFFLCGIGLKFHGSESNQSERA
jgi:hypothetical protein